MKVKKDGKAVVPDCEFCGFPLCVDGETVCDSYNFALKNERQKTLDEVEEILDKELQRIGICKVERDVLLSKLRGRKE